MSAPAPEETTRRLRVPNDWPLWKNRLLLAVAGWLAFAVLLALLDLTANVVPVTVAVVAALMIIWFVIDHLEANAVTQWPLNDLYRARGERGNDHSVASMAARLEAANSRREGRDALVHDLHWQLSRAIDATLQNKHGFTVEEEPDRARAVIPPELWAFVHEPPDPHLYRPETLNLILQRIEKW